MNRRGVIVSKPFLNDTRYSIRRNENKITFIIEPNLYGYRTMEITAELM